MSEWSLRRLDERLPTPWLLASSLAVAAQLGGSTLYTIKWAGLEPNEAGWSPPSDTEHMFASPKALVRSRAVSFCRSCWPARRVVGADLVRSDLSVQRAQRSVVVVGERVGETLECFDGRAELSAMFGEFVFDSWGDLGVDGP